MTSRHDHGLSWNHPLPVACSLRSARRNVIAKSAYALLWKPAEEYAIARETVTRHNRMGREVQAW